MSFSESLAPEITTADMQRYFANCADESSINGDLTMVSFGPPSWVAANTSGNTQAGEVALRLTYDTNLDSALEDTRKRVDLLQSLRSHGAQVVEYLEEPRVIYDAQRMGGFILTTSRYLPVKGATPFEHGQAIASLHNASLHVDTSNCEEINILEQIAPSGQIAEYLQGFLARGKTFQLGQAEMSPGQIEAYIRYLDEAEELRRGLFATSAQKGVPKVVVQEDVHDENIMRDNQGVPIAIDIDGYVGPPAIDLGRPLTDWHHRFGKPVQFTHDYIAGYDAHINPQLKPDQELRQMASDYMNIRSSVVFIAMAVNTAVQGQSHAEWLLDQGLHRMSVIADRDARWLPRDETRKIALRAQQKDS